MKNRIPRKLKKAKKGSWMDEQIRLLEKKMQEHYRTTDEYFNKIYFDYLKELRNEK